MKYRLTKNFIIQNDKILYQIEALKNFSDVEAGELGGYIESEKNLSQEGDCWLYGNVRVFDNAVVYGDARVSYYAKVFDDARVYGSAIVSDFARVYGNAKVYDNAEVLGFGAVYDNSIIS